MNIKRRITALFLTLAITPVLASCAAESTAYEENVTVHKVNEIQLDETTGDITAPAPENRTETVTVKADADGAFRSARVSISGDDMEKDADTSDIPFEVNISYFLDGKQISAKELSGASGKLKIRLDYINNSQVTVNVDGEEIGTMIPFAFISMILLPSERFSNIEVTNGGSIDIGDDHMVYAYALPGVENELKIEKVRDEIKGIGDKLDIESEDEDQKGSDSSDEEYSPLFPDYAEITADVINCKIEMNATIVTNGLFKDADDEDIENIEDAVKSLWDFGGIGGELADGVNELKDGAYEFGDGLESYVEGAEALAEGAYQLSSGAALIEGQSDNLKNGAAELASSLAQLQSQLALLEGMPGAKELYKAATALAEGAAQLSSGVDAYTEGVSGLTSGAEALGSGAWQLADAGDQLSSGYQKLLDGMDELADGVIEIRDRVFWNISSLSEGEAPVMIKSIKALKAADCTYTSITEGDITDGQEGSVRYIIEMDEIG